MSHNPNKSVVAVALLNSDGAIVVKKPLNQPLHFEEGGESGAGRQFLYSFDIELYLDIRKLEERSTRIRRSTMADEGSNDEQSRGTAG